ncbi:MAG: hypothetical protein O7H41_03885 [Planctomycetota bacterium]|nr:hypothetical protein [Planctomycetota bacterium]
MPPHSLPIDPTRPEEKTEISKEGKMRTAALVVAAFSAVLLSGCGCTPAEADFYTSRPKLTWETAPGSTSYVECWDYDTGEAIFEKEGYKRDSWRPEDDLEFEHTYRIEVVDDETGEHTLCGVFDVDFQTATLLSPLNEAEVWSMEPELQWEIADHPWPEARYSIQISLREDFKDVYWYPKAVGGPGLEKHFIGVDQTPGTEDDIDFVSIECDRVLEAEREYFWRVRVEYFKGSRPLGKGDWSETRQFFIPPQPTGEVMQDLVRLTTEDTQDKHPDISNAFDLVYEAHTSPGLSQIHIKRGRRQVNKIEFDPGVERFSTGDSIDRSPDWDSRGEGVAYSSNRTGSIYRILYKKTGSGGHQEITSTSRVDSETPEYSPDGAKLAYVEHDQGGIPHIWVIDSDGSKPTKITEGRHPSWSNDGSRIAYVLDNRAGGRKGELNPTNIWVWDKNTDTRTQITDTGSNLHPAWSQGDRKIAFSSNRSGNWDIWEIESKGGGELRQLTNYLGTDTQPVWTPDGEHLAFSSTRLSKDYNIWMGRVPPP